MSMEDKNLEDLAALQAVSDYSWHSWNSPVGLSFFFLLGAVSLLILAASFFVFRYALLLH